jgi:hypothetical protein
MFSTWVKTGCVKLESRLGSVELVTKIWLRVICVSMRVFVWEGSRGIQGESYEVGREKGKREGEGEGEGKEGKERKGRK